MDASVRPDAFTLLCFRLPNPYQPRFSCIRPRSHIHKCIRLKISRAECGSARCEAQWTPVCWFAVLSGGQPHAHLCYWLWLQLCCPKFTKVELQVKPRCRSAWPPVVNAFCCLFFFFCLCVHKMEANRRQVLILCMCPHSLNPNQPKRWKQPIREGREGHVKARKVVGSILMPSAKL